MSASAPLPADHPIMLAWNAFKADQRYENVRSWAKHPEHVDGSLWAAFLAGYEARAAEDDAEDMPEETRTVAQQVTDLVRGGREDRALDEPLHDKP